MTGLYFKSDVAGLDRFGLCCERCLGLTFFVAAFMLAVHAGSFGVGSFVESAIPVSCLIAIGIGLMSGFFRRYMDEIS